jgi:hypothetical protein
MSNTPQDSNSFDFVAEVRTMEDTRHKAELVIWLVGAVLAAIYTYMF